MRTDKYDAAGVLDIGSRRELFVDRYLVDRLNNATLFMHEPQQMPLPANPLRGSYMTVIKDGSLCRAYYRDYRPEYTGHKKDGNAGEITCYAESRDGHEWMFPALGIVDARSPRGDNVILAAESPAGGVETNDGAE